MSPWSNRYVGIPHAPFGSNHNGVNCWGLIVLVYAEQLGITLPTYEGRYASVEEQREISALVEEERGNAIWQRVDQPRPFDVLAFRQGRYVSHVGLVVAPKLMLHVKGEDHSKVEAFEAPLWNNRLAGIYRHLEAPSKVSS